MSRLITISDYVLIDFQDENANHGGFGRRRACSCHCLIIALKV